MCIFIKLMRHLNVFNYHFDAICNKQANIRLFANVIKAKKVKKFDEKEGFEAKFVISGGPKVFLGVRAVFIENINACFCMHEVSFFWRVSQVFTLCNLDHIHDEIISFQKCKIQKANLVLASIFNLSPKCHLPTKKLDSQFRQLSTYE